MQRACAIFSSEACPALKYFSTLSHKRHDFRKKKVTGNKMYYHKCTLLFMWSIRYSCQILMKLEFSRHVFEKYSNVKISWKSVQWELSCYIWMGRRIDRKTGMKKLTVAFRNFANAPKNHKSIEKRCLGKRRTWKDEGNQHCPCSVGNRVLYCSTDWGVALRFKRSAT